MAAIPREDDTIVALSTPPGLGGIAVVRLSGTEAVSILNKLLPPNKMISQKSHGMALVTTISDPSTGDTIDEVVVTFFKALHSYTTEDLVEISCHGGEYVQGQILNLSTSAGARIAEPGEFTKRAFLGGRIDLSQAEAVADLISAKVKSAHRFSISHMQGALKERTSSLRSKIVDLSALIEAELDFSDDEITPIPKEQIAEKINQVLEGIRLIAENYGYGKIVRNGAVVPIIGKSNVGKSSLLNALLAEERAIVTETPGTTRDLIECSVDIDGFFVRLIDTAGIRNTGESVEKLGIEKSFEQIKSADLILWLIDRSSPLQEDDLNIHAELKNREYITIESKSDLPQHKSYGPEKHNIIPDLAISNLTGKGLRELSSLISSRLKSYDIGEDAIITNARQTAALSKSEKSLKMALSSTMNNAGNEFISVDIRDAMNYLGEITGEITTDDVLNEIFGRFCIGK